MDARGFALQMIAETTPDKALSNEAYNALADWADMDRKGSSTPSLSPADEQRVRNDDDRVRDGNKL